MLARLLDVPETQGIGIGLALWQWALEVANDGDFGGHVPDPALVSAACGWPLEDGARLITELQRVGLVATAPVLRVRGLDRYRRAWEKNRRKNTKHAFSVDDVPETGANQRGTREEPARQNKTQKKNKNTEEDGATRSRDSDLLCGDYQSIIGAKYAWQGAKDGAALKALLKHTSIDEIRKRWRVGLGLEESKWPSVRTVAQLNSKWNDLAGLHGGDWRSRIDPNAGFWPEGEEQQ